MNLKKAKWLIPLLALLVIFESILVVERLSKKVSQEERSSLPVELKEEEPVMISWEGENQIVAGEEGEVKVVMTTLKNLALDGIDVLIEYDPEYLEIIGTDPSDRFSYLARNWIEPEKKRILVSMLETDLPEGVSFEAGEGVTLLTIKYTALKSGKTKLKIIGGDDQAGTVLAENGTAQKIPFTSEEFMIKID